MQSGFGLTQGYGGPATDAHLGRLSGIAIDAAGSILTEGVSYGFVYKVGPAALLDFQTKELHTVNTLALIVENNSATTLTFTGNAFTVNWSSFAAAATVSNACTASTSLAPGASCRITVKFAPQETADYTGALTVTDGVGSQVVMLKGSGVRPTPDVSDCCSYHRNDR